MNVKLIGVVFFVFFISASSQKYGFGESEMDSYVVDHSEKLIQEATALVEEYGEGIFRKNEQVVRGPSSIPEGYSTLRKLIADGPNAFVDRQANHLIIVQTVFTHSKSGDFESGFIIFFKDMPSTMSDWFPETHWMLKGVTKRIYWFSYRERRDEPDLR